MDTVAHPLLLRLIAQVKSDPEILAVLLFGSRARGDASSASDFDVCLVLGPDVRYDLAAAHKRLAYLAEVDLNFVIFQQLPLHIRSRVLKEGEVIFVRD